MNTKPTPTSESDRRQHADADANASPRAAGAYGPLGLLPDFAVSKSTHEKLLFIESYDLSDIKKSIIDKFDEIAAETNNKLQKPLSPCKPAEMRKYIDLLEKEFKKFLTLRLLFPSEDVRFVPSRIVDRMWHKFIVDTRR